MFKSILNTLQKNVIGATIFGKSSTMNTSSEETIPAEAIPLVDVAPTALEASNSSAEEIENTVDGLVDCDDPLSDPLALDDSSTSVEQVESVNPTLADLDTSTDGQIILIDVNILRNVEQNELLTESSRETETEDLTETIEEGVRSDGSDSGLASDGSIVEVRPQISEIVSRHRSCLKRRSSESIATDNSKRAKRNIKFDCVNVFYFQRLQGNSCVPSLGGCSLGMARHHMHNRTFSLAEHAAEQRRIHRLQDMNANISSTDDTDTDDEPSENSGSDVDTESSGFLQPVPPRQRRLMLKTAGVLKIDTNEKDECRAIRTSREFCGCNCRGFCDPDTCFCSQSGIKCQVDRANFPCGCTLHGCDNVVGRVEFDPERVRIHFIHTIFRLELENKQNLSEEMLFKNVSCQWDLQTRPPDVSTNAISEFSHCSYTPVYENSSHRTSAIATDGSMKDYDGIVEPMPSSHEEENNLIELANRTSDEDTLNLHYDYRNDYSTDSIVHSNVVANDIEDQPNYSKLYTNHDPTVTMNSFNSTFSEFVERTYNLGGSDYQQHSTYLSSSHSEPSSSGTVHSSNVSIDEDDDVRDESIPNRDILFSPSDNNRKPVDITSLLENDGEFHMNNVINSNVTQIADSPSTSAVKNLLNTEIDVELEIPSVLVNVEKEKIPNIASYEIGENILTSVFKEEELNTNEAKLNNL